MEVIADSVTARMWAREHGIPMPPWSQPGPWCTGCDVLQPSLGALNDHAVEAVLLGAEWADFGVFT